MSFSLVASGGGTGDGSTVASATLDTATADLIVINLVGTSTMAGKPPTDSNGNTWTQVASATTIAPSTVDLWYCLSPTVGAGHEFHSPAGGSYYPSMQVQAWSGAAASSALDQTNENTAASGTSLQPGSITPTQNGELIVTGVLFNSEGTTNIAINDSFDITNSYPGVTVVYYGGGIAYLVQSTAAAINPTWTWAPSMDAAAVIASFKAPSSGSFLPAWARGNNRAFGHGASSP